MSWLKIDDGFEDHPKVEPISDAAHRLWTRAACWCQKTGSDGFVPRAMLLAISKNAAPLKRLERLAQELVDATAGGIFEHGLWDPVTDGWLFHDWKDYQPEHTKQTTLTRSEAASVAGRASADARRTKYGTAQPVRPERPPNDSGTFESSFDERRSGDVRRTELERPEPPDPDPGSDLSDLETLSKEPDRSVRQEPEPAAPREKPAHVVKFERSFEAPLPAGEQLFEAYRIESAKVGVRYDHRMREIFERLVDEGETPTTIRQAVQGAKLDPWARDTAKLAASPILGTSDQREKFRAIARDPPRPKGVKAPRQPNSVGGFGDQLCAATQAGRER